MTEPTRLLLFQGSHARMYQGAKCTDAWETGDEDHPMDGAYYEELMPVVFDETWFIRAQQQGRYFPVLALQGQVMSLQAKLTYAYSKILA